MTILVVDDSKEVRDIFRAVLDSDGYDDVVALGSASDAYEFLALNDPEAMSPKVELILLDVIMPDVDGIEACTKIRMDRRYTDVPIVMATARKDLASIKTAIACGATDYLTKPMKFEDLLACVCSKLKLKGELDKRSERERYLEQHVPFSYS